MRNRAKEHFPSVLLTLLSIVQAIALELLWSHVTASDYLYEPTWIAALAWAQITGTFLTLILVWVVYASSAMRFRWTPVTSDSVYPFFIGLIEFMLIETLGPDEFGQWMLFIALAFAVMHWVTHANMKRARLDADNQTFFRKMEPARLRDFYPHLAVVGILVTAGVYLFLSANLGLPALFILLTTNGFLGWQFYTTAQFWERSMMDTTDP